MDIMESTQVTNEEIQFHQNEFKTEMPTIENYNNGMSSTTNSFTHNNEEVYNIPLPPTTEYQNHQISEQQKNETNMEIQETELISPESNVKNVDSSDITPTEIGLEPVETSNENLNNENEEIPVVPNEIQTQAPFVNDIDESVSLPPAEPLVIEKEDVKHENATEIVQQQEITAVSTEEIIEPANEEIIESVVEETSETATEEVVHSTSEEVVNEPMETEDNLNVQYTVLPPGENSVIQEDGTLVVEYPMVASLNEEEEEEGEDEETVEKNETLNSSTEEKTSASSQKQHKPKGRKSSGQIPSHIVGHSIEKPTELANGGKTALKPRLGVKIPYRNLTSQMISNSELRQQIVERARQKQEAQMEASKSRIFAKKLTYRLAQSLTGKGKIGKRNDDENTSEKTEQIDETDAKQTVRENIENNSDLIAILEGDGEETIITHVAETSDNTTTCSEMKEIEKEISASEQKTQVKGKKFFKSRDTTKDKIKDAQSKITTAIMSGGNVEKHEDSDEDEENDEIEEVKEKLVQKISPRKHQKRSAIVEFEPQLKPAMVVKTYTRKRKSNDSPTPVEPPKKTMLSPQTSTENIDFVPPNVYMTKSSRIIKKKVIWDPDEASPTVRNQTKILNKIEAATPPKPTTPKLSPKLEKKEAEKKPLVKSPNEEKIKNLRSASPASKSPKKYGKRLSEIDKLLMDEGAVNMLYDINNSDDQKRRASARSSGSSAKVQEIPTENSTPSKTTTTITTTIRKKDAPKKEIGARKMSKDSSKSSLHSPPPSPADFSAVAEASRIIRRHSSSSFSSNDEEVPEDYEIEEKQTRRKQAVFNVETDQPKKTESTNTRKKQKKNEEIEIKPEENEMEIEKPVEITVKSAPSNLTEEMITDPSKLFTVIKMNKHYMINLTYSGNENYLTLQMLKDLTVTFKELGKNKNCNVVSVHSQGSAFCLGLDYKILAESTDDLRKKRATELSNVVREFLKCLLNFPKVLVAGIKSDCIGFAVTILPLFDIVIASDSASFFTPYGKLGCPPEVGFLLSVPFHSNNGLAAELLYTTHRVSADEAHKRGLITKLFWPEKFDVEFLAFLTHISNLSKMSLIATKKQLRQVHFQQIESLITSNFKSLVDRWSSEECQKNFANYNALTCDLDK